jgi:hypothetical protein
MQKTTRQMGRAGLLLLLLGLSLPAFAQTAPNPAPTPSPTATATVTVGPQDNTAGPSLPPLLTPTSAQPPSTLVVEETMPDTGYPAWLEQQGNLPAALMAWQKLAYDTSGAERGWALLQVAHLQTQLQQFPLAAQTLSNLRNDAQLNAFTTPRTAELVYRQLWVTPLAEQGPLQATVQTLPAGPWRDATLLLQAWQRVQAGGRVPATPQATSPLPEWLVTVPQTLQRMTTLAEQNAMLAAMLSVLPGLGHLWLQAWVAGALSLLAWALFGWAFMSACRHRHYAYACVWVWPFVGLWLQAPVGAHALAMQQAHAKERALLTKTQQQVDATLAQLLNAPPKP